MKVGEVELFFSLRLKLFRVFLFVPSTLSPTLHEFHIFFEGEIERHIYICSLIALAEFGAETVLAGEWVVL